MDALKRFLTHPFIAHSSWLFGSRISQVIVSFCAQIVLARHLLPEEFGRFALVETVVALVVGTVNAKIPEAILRPPRELGEERKDVLFSVLVAESIIWIAVACPVIWMMGLWSLEVVVFMFGVVLSRWTTVQIAFYEIAFHYKNIALIRGGSHLFSKALVVVGVVSGVGPLVLYAHVLLYAVAEFFGLLIVGGTMSFRPPRCLSLREWKTLFVDLRELWLDGCLENIFDRLPVFLVGWIAGEKAAGYFFKSLYLAQTPNTLLRPVTRELAYNYFSHRANMIDPPAQRMRQNLSRALAIQLALLGVVGGAVVLLADPLVRFLFGEKWAPVVPLLQAMTGVILAMSPFNTLRAFFMAERRMRTFILFGLGPQWVALAVATLVMFVYHTPVALTLALGISAAYVLGSLALFASCVTRR